MEDLHKRALRPAILPTKEEERMDSVTMGTVVRLKSGGPPMTVKHTFPGGEGQQLAICQWFHDGEGRSETFPSASLEAEPEVA